MDKAKKLISIFVITIIINLIIVLLELPTSGGILLISIGVFWFVFQLWKLPEITISKTYFFYIILTIYLLAFAQYSKPIPKTDILVQRALIFLLLAILSHNALRSESVRIRWENSLILLAIIVSVCSISEIIGWYDRYSTTIKALQVLPDPKFAYRLSGSLFGHPNPLAGFLNFVWPIVLLRFLNAKEVSRKFLFGIGLLLFSITIFYTNSRGALLGAFVGILVIIIPVSLRKSRFFRNSVGIFKINIQGKFKSLSSIGFVLMLFLGVIWRTNFTGQARLKNFSGRGTIWQYSWEAFIESPIFGQGIAAFPISYTKFAQLPPGDFAPSAHNLWMQVSVDYGLIGLIFICGLVIFIAYFGIKKHSTYLTTHLHFSLAYLAGGSAFLAQQTVDYMLVTTGYLVVFMMILILTTRYALSINEWEINKRVYTAAGVALISLIVIYQGIISSKIVNPTENNLRVSLANSEQWNLLQKQICLNLDRNPDNALYRFDCSQAISRQMSRHLQNGEINRNLLDQALLSQQLGYDLNPYWTIQEANLAVLFWMRGDRQTAITHMNHAANAAPMYDLLWVNLGWMEEKLGNQGNALFAYNRALRINPLIAKSVFSKQSLLISKAAEDLAEWGNSDHLWHDWYDGSRHDRAIFDFDHWKGVIALSIGQTELAVESMEASLKNGFTPNIPIYLSYTYELNEQDIQSFGLAQDIALLKNNQIKYTKLPRDFSMIASILRTNGDYDLAYDLFTETYNIINTGSVYEKYYPAIYGEQILISDISPWLIRSHLILLDTQDDWVWFAEEAFRRGDIQLSKDIKEWQQELNGIVRLTD